MQATIVSEQVSAEVLESARDCAASRAVEQKRGTNALFRDPYAYALAGEAAVKRAFEKNLIGNRSPRIAIRTRWFDDFLELTLKQYEFSQMVLLGVGFDMRAYRLSCLISTTVFEIDASPVLSAKRDALSQISPSPLSIAKGIRSLSADLNNDDWGSKLEQIGFDASTPTVWIAEGMLYYLTPAAVNQLFQTIARLSAAGSRIAFSAITRPARVQKGLSSFFQSWMSDPHAFLLSHTFTVDTVDVFGGPRAHFGRCLPHDIREEDMWKHGQATIYVAATKSPKSQP